MSLGIPKIFIAIGRRFLFLFQFKQDRIYLAFSQIRKVRFSVLSDLISSFVGDTCTQQENDCANAIRLSRQFAQSVACLLVCFFGLSLSLRNLSSDTLAIDIDRSIPILSHPRGTGISFFISSREPELILFDLLGSSPTAHQLSPRSRFQRAFCLRLPYLSSDFAIVSLGLLPAIYCLWPGAVIKTKFISK